MTTKTLGKMNSLILVMVLAFGTAQAADQSGSVGSHEEHHPETQTPKKSGEGKDMMGKMDMNQMSGMMHECMEMHKDGKMCEHQTMEQCQGKMDKSECGKMMKEVKKSEKKSKKK